uniref:Phosphatidylinositol-glycan biosynthesis class W protein n=1 Tax=Callorhinchus milii TaxID=7868 RepID=A0A4W3KC10_CALMI|eukprot:gi/632958006/ref/XP_007894792.1/ PREDICTED: phosphatidylinositol-glycan biosynthesis class W protein isoform X1 [Callorhinchus milii]
MNEGFFCLSGKINDPEMSLKELKVAFVSDLTGTNLFEVLLGLILPSLCVVCRGLVLIYSFRRGAATLSWKSLLLMDFSMLVASLVLCCTVLSDALHWVVLSLSAILGMSLFQLYQQRRRYRDQRFKEIVRLFSKTSLEMNRIPFVTVFRVFVNIMTCIAILAVDFRIFPRRYAKAEIYGTGIMDFGVGAFVFANALVSPEARQKSKSIFHSKFTFVAKQFISVWPLVFLGLARLLSVKGIDYHEHLSEYGVHWNFFFTLAVVRILSSFLMALCPVSKTWVLSASIAMIYQWILETTNLKQFILHGSDGKDNRNGFINANREGLFSVFGYIAIYIAGVQSGLYIMKRRALVEDWIKMLPFLVLGTVVSWLLLYACEVCIEPVSRKLSNLTFVIWVVGQCFFFLILYMLADLVLVFAKMLSGVWNVPSSWNNSPELSQSSSTCSKSKTSGSVNACLIEAISRNQLFFFLLSNVLTGVVNLAVDTIHCDAFISIIVLFLYMFCNCLVVTVLHIKNITLKFW